MSTTGTEKHCRLCLMLNKGGTKACHSLLLNRVKELTPRNHQPHPWSVDEFLQSKKNELSKSNISKEKLQVLFPRTGVTDVSKWDLSLFCVILTTYCELKQLTRLDVEHLRTFRNKLCHMNEPSIDEKKYQDYFETIKVVIVRILEKVNDCETKEATEKILDDIHHGPLSLVETLKEMHTFYSMETDIREKFEYIKEAEDRVLQKVEKFDEKMDQIVTKLDHKASSKLDSARNNFLLPEVKMNLDLKNLSEDEEQSMSATVEQLFEEVINEDEGFKSIIPTESYTRLREAVRKTFQLFLSKGWRITSAKHECVQFHIRCSSFTSLAALFREHIQGEINNELTGLKEAISESLGGKESQLETVIYKDDFWSVMDKTVSAVDDFLNDENGDSIPTLHRRLLPSADEQKHTLTITARNVNHDGPQSFNEVCVNELDSCARLLETELGTEFNASHVSIQTSYTPKMPEKTKDEVRSDDKYTATPKDENIEKELVNFPSTRKSVSGVELQSHGSHSKTSASADSSDREQTIALLELYRSQIAVAHFLKLAYISVHDEFASEIYLTIQSARSAHEMSHLTPIFHLDCLSNRLPSILNGLRGERKYIHMGCVESAIHDARQLKDDDMELQGSYTKLLDEISSDIKLLTMQRKTKTANVLDKMSDVSSEKLADVDRSKAKKGMYEYDEYISTSSLPKRLRISDSSDEDTDFGRNKLPEEMIAERKAAEYTGKYSLKHEEGKGQSKPKKYDDWRNTMGKRIPFGVVELDTVLTNLRSGSALMTGGLSLKELKEMNPPEMILSIRLEKESGTLKKDMSQTQGLPGTVKPSFVHQTKYIEEVDSLETIREQEGNTCIEYLQQVYKHLKYIDLQLTRIADSWSNLSTALEQLKANEETLRLQTVSSRPDFNEKIDMLEKEWIFVTQTFEAYCAEEYHVKHLYDFLPDRIMFDIFHNALYYKQGIESTEAYLSQDPGKSSALHLATDVKGKHKSSKEHDSADSKTPVL